MSRKIDVAVEQGAPTVPVTVSEEGGRQINLLRGVGARHRPPEVEPINGSLWSAYELGLIQGTRKMWTAEDYRAKSREYAQRALKNPPNYSRRAMRRNERELKVDEHPIGERLNDGLKEMFQGGEYE